MLSDFNTQGLNFGGNTINSYSNQVTPTSSGAGSGSGAGGGMIASGVISGLSEIYSSMINAKRLKDISSFNSGMAALQKRVARLSADTEIRNIRKKAQSLFSTQRAVTARSGLSMSGSPALVAMESLKEAGISEIYANINADLGISTIDTQNEINRMNTKQAINDQYTGIGKSVLNMGNKYMLYKYATKG
jgi:hypothetical protein